MSNEKEETTRQQVRDNLEAWQTKVLGRAIFKHGYMTAAAKKASRQLRTAGIAPKKKPVQRG